MSMRVLLVTLALTSVNAHAATSPYPYQSCFEVAAKLHDVPLDLLLAVAATESNWDPDARSHANAHGIMQIQWPGTARHLGVRRVAELYNPCLNIELGARYLRELIDMNGGDVERALAAYNYGPGRIQRSGASLPAGAQRYANTVNAHQYKINRTIAPSAETPRAGSQHELARFASAARAKRYASLLAAHISGASFAWNKSQAGDYPVAMTIDDRGLSAIDLATLKRLGIEL
jgi:hypothetical protein